MVVVVVLVSSSSAAKRTRVVLDTQCALCVLLVAGCGCGVCCLWMAVGRRGGGSCKRAAFSACALRDRRFLIRQ